MRFSTPRASWLDTEETITKHSALWHFLLIEPNNNLRTGTKTSQDKCNSHTLYWRGSLGNVHTGWGILPAIRQLAQLQLHQELVYSLQGGNPEITVILGTLDWRRQLEEECPRGLQHNFSDGLCLRARKNNHGINVIEIIYSKEE